MLVFAVLLGAAIAGRSQAGDPVPGVSADDLAACSQLLDAYVAAVRVGDVEQAAACWRQEDIASADRLGIRYRQAPLKVDGDSPLWLQGDA